MRDKGGYVGKPQHVIWRRYLSINL